MQVGLLTAGLYEAVNNTGVLASSVSSHPCCFKQLGSAHIAIGSRWGNGLPSQRRVGVSERSNSRNGSEIPPWGLTACSSGESSTMAKVFMPFFFFN